MTMIATKTIVMTGRLQMDSSLLRARSATHLKIVLVSLVAAMVVVIVGVNARTTSFDTAATATGPAVVKAVTGEDVSLEELGGARTHSQVSGNSHYLAANEDDALEYVRDHAVAVAARLAESLLAAALDAERWLAAREEAGLPAEDQALTAQDNPVAGTVGAR